MAGSHSGGPEAEVDGHHRPIIGSASPLLKKMPQPSALSPLSSLIVEQFLDELQRVAVRRLKVGGEQPADGAEKFGAQQRCACIVGKRVGRRLGVGQSGEERVGQDRREFGHDGGEQGAARVFPLRVGGEECVESQDHSNPDLRRNTVDEEPEEVGLSLLDHVPRNRRLGTELTLVRGAAAVWIRAVGPLGRRGAWAPDFVTDAGSVLAQRVVPAFPGGPRRCVCRPSV